MGDRTGKCTNFDNCDTADGKIEITILSGEDFICRECGQDLMEVIKKGGGGSGPGVQKIGIGLLAFLLLAALVGGIYFIASSLGGSSGVNKIIGLLENGEFDKAVELAESVSKPDEEMEKMIEQIETRIRPSVQFQYRNANGSASQPEEFGSSDLDNLLLTKNDDFRISLNPDSENGDLYFDVFHIDWKGKVYRLFPESKFTKTANPVPEDETVTLPEGDDWFFPDALSNEGDIPVMESIHVIASYWKAGDVESLFNDVEKEKNSKKREKLVAEFVKRLEIRKNGKHPFLYYGKISFMHGVD